MEQPDAIDEHARHQRLLTTREPAGVGEAAAGGGERWVVAANGWGDFRFSIFDFGFWIGSRQYRQLTWLNLLLRLIHVAAVEDEGLWDLAGNFGEAGDEIFGRA